MLSNKECPKNIDEYIKLYPKDVQLVLESLRQAIHKAAPNSEEAIKYQIPTFTFHGNLVHFGAYKNHIGFYPGSSIINEVFKKDLVKYKTSKGTIQFPLESTIPVSLVKKLVKYKAKQNLERPKAKPKKKK